MKKNIKSTRKHFTQTNNIEIILQLYKLEKAAASKKSLPLLPIHDQRRIVTGNNFRNQNESKIIQLLSDYMQQASQIFFKKHAA